MTMTKDEIKAELDARGIEYDDSATKDELAGLLAEDDQTDQEGEEYAVPGEATEEGATEDTDAPTPEELEQEQADQRVQPGDSESDAGSAAELTGEVPVTTQQDPRVTPLQGGTGGNDPVVPQVSPQDTAAG